jgi:N-acyl-phosphatidylethanolamine-hydrolysing phospholipase D
MRSIRRGKWAAVLLVLGMQTSCAEFVSAPIAQPWNGATEGAPRSEGGFRNVVSPPPPDGAGASAMLWLRKIWTTLVPRPGAAERTVKADFAAGGSTPSLTWIGHATFLVRMDGVTFLTDPMFSDWAGPGALMGPKRAVPPGVLLPELPVVNFAVISHDHYDHADAWSVKQLAARGVQFIVPLGLGAWVREMGGKAIELDWWQHVEIAGVRVHCVPAQHGSGRSLHDAGRRLWAGWVISGPTRRFYHAGDTGHWTGLNEIGRRLGPIDVAALPIGAYDTPSPGPYLHLTPEQAVHLGQALGARRIVAMHYGTFDLSDEPMDEPPRRFRAEAERLSVPPEQIWVPPKVGETLRW